MSSQNDAGPVPPVAAGRTVHVIATSVAATREALGVASALARGMAGRLAVFLCRRSTDSLNTDEEAASKEIKRLVGSLTPLPTVISCVFDHPVAMAQLFVPPGFVVIGGSARWWWPTPEQRLAQELANLGCHVAFVHATDVQFVSSLATVREEASKATGMAKGAESRGDAGSPETA